jgi:hypothetical protein
MKEPGRKEEASLPPVSQSELSRVSCGAQWEPSRRQRYCCRTSKSSFGETQGTPKNTEAEYIPDILHVLGSGSLLQIVKV